MALELEILPDADAAAERGAEIIAAAAQAAVAERGSFTLAASGGHAPWTMFAALYGRMPWDKVTIFQVDERVAPDGHPDRNLTQLQRSLPPGGAAVYADALPERLDLVHLGLGPDGHTASLVPGDAVLEVMDRDVAVTGEYQGRRRMTLTYPALNRARQILWLVTGDDKPDALTKLRAGDESIPGGRISTEDAIVVADAAAAGSGT